MNRKGMQNIFVKRLSGLLCAWLFPFAALYAQVDTTTYHQLSGVEVLGKVRPSTTRESTPLQVMDKAGISSAAELTRMLMIADPGFTAEPGAGKP